MCHYRYNSTWWNSAQRSLAGYVVLKYNISQYKDFTLTVDFKNHIRGDYEEDGVTKNDNWEMRYGAFVGLVLRIMVVISQVGMVTIQE